MKTKLFAIALIALTATAVGYYPTLNAKRIEDPAQVAIVPGQQPVIDAVFVLDTTGSMSGLIQTAKEKIWSIASTMAAAQPTPAIRIGLVAYRDRGDAYVTRVVDLSDDLDSVYAALVDLEAGGGGDGPESVNRALHDAVFRMNWTGRDEAYRVIFLVGDAPPHMDYQDEMQYPAIVAAAGRKGIVVNTIQCGTVAGTIAPWTQIAQLGRGEYFQVEQAGGAFAAATPFDDEIATLASKLDDTRLYYGSREVKARMQAKVEATEKVAASAPTAALARRGVFNASAAGRANLVGEQELIDAVASGEVDLDEIDREDLPEVLKPMTPAEQRETVERLAKERADVATRIRGLAEKRDAYIRDRIAEAGGAEDSLDQKIYSTVSRQAGAAGLEYGEGPSY